MLFWVVPLCSIWAICHQRLDHGCKCSVTVGSHLHDRRWFQRARPFRLLCFARKNMMEFRFTQLLLRIGLLIHKQLPSSGGGNQVCRAPWQAHIQSGGPVTTTVAQMFDLQAERTGVDKWQQSGERTGMGVYSLCPCVAFFKHSCAQWSIF